MGLNHVPLNREKNAQLTTMFGVQRLHLDYAKTPPTLIEYKKVTDYQRSLYMLVSAYRGCTQWRRYTMARQVK